MLIPLISPTNHSVPPPRTVQQVSPYTFPKDSGEGGGSGGKEEEEEEGCITCVTFITITIVVFDEKEEEDEKEKEDRFIFSDHWMHRTYPGKVMF